MSGTFSEELTAATAELSEQGNDASVEQEDIEKVPEEAEHSDDSSRDADLSDETAKPEEDHENEEDAEDPDGVDESGKRQQAAERYAPAKAKVASLDKRYPDIFGPAFNKHPELRRELESALRRDATTRKSGYAPADIRALGERFPRGMRDIEELEERLESSKAVDDKYYSGNPQQQAELSQQLYLQDPKAFTSMMRVGLAQLSRADRESYAGILGSVVDATFRERGISEKFDALQSTFDELQKNPDNEKAQNNFSNAFTYFMDVFGKTYKDIGSYAAAPGKPDPSSEAEQLRQRLADIEKRDAEASGNEREVQYATRTFTNGVGAIDRYITRNTLLPKGFNEEQRKHIIGNVYMAVRDKFKTLRGGRDFESEKQFRSAGQTEQAERIWQNAFQSLAPEIVKNTIRAERQKAAYWGAPSKTAAPKKRAPVPSVGGNETEAETEKPGSFDSEWKRLIRIHS